jgi:hypothetical protein
VPSSSFHAVFLKGWLLYLEISALAYSDNRTAIDKKSKTATAIKVANSSILWYEFNRRPIFLIGFGAVSNAVAFL